MSLTLRRRMAHRSSVPRGATSSLMRTRFRAQLRESIPAWRWRPIDRRAERSARAALMAERRVARAQCAAPRRYNRIRCRHRGRARRLFPDGLLLTLPVFVVFGAAPGKSRLDNTATAFRGMDPARRGRRRRQHHRSASSVFLRPDCATTHTPTLSATRHRSGTDRDRDADADPPVTPAPSVTAAPTLRHRPHHRTTPSPGRPRTYRAASVTAGYRNLRATMPTRNDRRRRPATASERTRRPRRARGLATLPFSCHGTGRRAAATATITTARRDHDWRKADLGLQPRRAHPEPHFTDGDCDSNSNP